MMYRDSFLNKKKLLNGKFKKMEASNESINSLRTFAYYII